jgi:two-component system CheB/CheR fusion protein
MPTPRRQNAPATPRNGQLDELLSFIDRTRGFDFSGYKRSTLERRIAKRMDLVGVEDYESYRDFLELNAHEFADLFDTILINVTGFFRDRPAWDYVAETVVPKLLEELPDARPVRVWTAGCATGEEAYTVAMILAEALGEEAFRRRVKIYATDADERALTKARHAEYGAEVVKDVPEELLERYFDPTSAGFFRFRPELRRSVIFGRNDLVQDAPISRIDLLTSRNVLMYFTADAQVRILERFNFALNETGYLFLGRAEMLITHTDLFKPVDLKSRVFRRASGSALRERLAFVGATGIVEPEGDGRHAELRSGAIALAPVAQVIVDRGGFVIEVNQRARDLFGLGTQDVGRPFQDLELSYRPVDLRSAIERALADRSAVHLPDVRWVRDGGDERVIDIAVTPVPGLGANLLGTTVSAQDVTAVSRVNEENERRKRELESAYETLQSTVEELETTNEELQSTNEELETTNEELQSTNEELETMNEELHSTNDELEVLNDEQNERARELDRVNMFLEGILGSLGVGVIVVDDAGVVQLWNSDSRELWGLGPDEAEGEPLMELDIGLPLDAVREVLDTAVREQKRGSVLVDAVNRRGRSFECLVRALPLVRNDGELYGAILVMSDPRSDPNATVAAAARG